MKYYKGNITPEENTIFVFGSNYEGRHGGGSARVAVLHFGAIYGNGRGMQGNSYALITTDLRTRKLVPLDEITKNVVELYQCADENTDKNFKVAYRSQLDEHTLCGYSGCDLIGCFKNAEKIYGSIPSNIYFSEEWYNNWDKV